MSIKSMKFRKVSLAAIAALSTAGLVAAPTSALAQAQCSEDSGPSKTLNPRVATDLQVVFEQMQAEQYQQALAGLNQLINSRGDSMADFDKATTYELRGSVKASLENYRGALQDFQVALNTGALPQSRQNQLRYFIAQLNFQLEDYNGAINGLNQWIRFAQQCGQNVDPSAYYLLAAAYTQISPPNWRAAVDPAQKAIAGAPEPKKNYYDLLNLVYSELNDNTRRAPLLEQMVNIWPGTKAYWTQLSGAYSVDGKDQDAFSVLEVAYRAGLLSTESELLTLIQYYSFFENPYRGAVLLEREMNAGNIARSQKNLVLLSQLWSQAREHKRSIPILREAASGAPNGELFYRLGQVLLADEQYRAAEQALTNAVNRGGMDSDDTGDAWLLLGTAQFSQAGPEDTEIWARARRSFVNAQRYPSARQRAAGWVNYIDAVRSTYEAQNRLERQQRREQCQDDLRRLEQQERIDELQSRQITAAEQAERDALKDRCNRLLAGENVAEEEAEESPAEEEAAPAEDTEEAAEDGAAEGEGGEN